MKIQKLPIFNINTPHKILLHRSLYAYLVNICLILVGFFLYFFFYGYGAFLTSTIPLYLFLYAVVVGLPLALALLPGLIISIILHARNFLTDFVIRTSLVRIILIIFTALWFSNNFNKGASTQTAIQIFAAYIVIDVLYHAYVLVRAPRIIFKISAIVFLGIFAWTLTIVPWNDIVRLNWSTIQGMPLTMFVYYISFLSLYTLLASIGLIATRR